jgi:hypothetical protein
MKKSRAVPVTLLAAAAFLSLTGCEKKKQLQRCVDESRNVVEDGKCEDKQRQGGAGIHGYPFYRWYYGGGGYVVGQPAMGGSFDPAPHVDVVRASSPEGAAIIRGGFGQGFTGGAAG